MCAPRANETGSPGKANLCEATATHLECVLCNGTLRRIARWKYSRLGLYLSYGSNVCLLAWGWAPPKVSGMLFLPGLNFQNAFVVVVVKVTQYAWEQMENTPALGLIFFLQLCLSGKALNLTLFHTDQYIWEISCSSNRNFISGMFTNTEFWSNTWG